MTDDLIKELEQYVCCLYDGKISDINALRNEIFWKTLKNKKWVVDLIHLPTSRSSSKLHARRSNYIAKIWRLADQKIMVYESPQQHGWNEIYSLEWVDDIFPTDIAKHQDARNNAICLDVRHEKQLYLATRISTAINHLKNNITAKESTPESLQVKSCKDFWAASDLNLLITKADKKGRLMTRKGNYTNTKQHSFKWFTITQKTKKSIVYC